MLATYYLERCCYLLMIEKLYYNKEIPEKNRKLVSEPVNEDLIKKNKFANNSSYVPESVYRRILNKVCNHEWSFVPHSIEEKGEGKDKHVQYVGLLIVPGFGVHTGIGTHPLNKKDNSKATAAAKTYAFKNACKEMGLAPNIGDGDYEEPIFENIDDEEFQVEEEKPAKKAPSSKVKKKAEPKKKKELTTEERIEEVRQAYELDKDDDFVAFIQIWDEDILELEDMDDDDWDEFLEYLEENKEEFEEF